MKILFLTLLLSFAVTSYAQIRFEPGYLVDNSGIKTECFIRNIDWKDNPSEIEYKTTLGSKSTKASISEISAFQIMNGPEYHRFDVKIDYSDNSLNNLNHRRNPEFKQQTVFLLLLVTGEAKLYSYEKANTLCYFFSTNEHEIPEQLIFKEFLNEDGSIGQNNHFKQQLFNSMKSEMLFSKDFANLDYDKQSLINLFMKFNGVHADSVRTAGEVKVAGKFCLKPSIGIALSKLTLGNTLGRTYDLGKGSNMVIGIEAEYILPINKNKWAVFVAPNYQRYQYNLNTDNILTSRSADYRFISIPAGVRHYLFLTNKSVFSVNAGYAFVSNMDSFIKIGTYEVQVTNSSQPFVGAGYSYRKIGAEFRYNFKRDFVKTMGWISSYSSAEITLQYRFL